MPTKQNKPLVVTEEALAEFVANGEMRNIADAFAPNRYAAIVALAQAMGKK